MGIQNEQMYFAEKFNVSVKKLWNALYNPKGWDPWFTDGMRIEEDGNMFFRWVRLTDVEEVLDRGKVLVVVPEKVFEFLWFEEEDGFRSRVEFKLTAVGDNSTVLEIRDTIFVKDEEELHIRYNCAYGWGQMMTLLKAYLEKGIVLI